MQTLQTAAPSAVSLLPMMDELNHYYLQQKMCKLLKIFDSPIFNSHMKRVQQMESFKVGVSYSVLVENISVLNINIKRK